MTTDNSGRSRTFDVVVNGSSLIITVTSTVENVDAQPPSTDNKSFRIDVDGRSFRVEVASGKIPAAIPHLPEPVAPTFSPSIVPATLPIAEGEAVLTAPIPGTIVRYTVAEAQLVKAGETVVVLEAMKMENEISSPIDGNVIQCLVMAGQTVNKGQLLMIIK